MIRNLQALRGIAALAVVFYHTDFQLPGGVHTEFQAVAIFFVISGFIMAYVTRKGDQHFLRDRAIRIIPLYWVCTIVWAFAHGPRDIGDMTMSLMFIPYWNFHGEIQPVLGVGWTLNMEMFFYLLFALALLVSTRLAPLVVIGALLIVRFTVGHFGCGAAMCAAYSHDYILFFVPGIILYYAWETLLRMPAVMKAKSAQGVALTFAFAIFLGWQSYELIPKAGSWWSHYAWPPLVVFAALGCEAAGLRCGMWALVLGNTSYAAYLTHPFVLGALRRFLDFKDSFPAMLVALIAALALALGTYYLLELPFTKWLKSLAAVRSPGECTAASSPG